MLIRTLGRADYQATWDAMRAFTDARTPASEDELWVCEHAPVFTQGIAGKAEHLLVNPAAIPVLKTDRGGQITYHGPGQTMVYVLLDLRRAGYGVRELVQRIERGVIELLAGYGIAAYGKRDAPGVYVRLHPSPAGGRGAGGEGEPAAALAKTRRVPTDLLSYAQQMRRNATDAESLLWHLLRNRSLLDAKFRRQYATREGDARYILDFYCVEHKLVIELDGGQHVLQAQYDDERSAWLSTQGIRVLRFWNDDVLLRTDAVLEVIYDALLPAAAPSPLPLSRQRERGSVPLPAEPLTLQPDGAPEAKIASLGLKVRNGCTYHGVAFNVAMDLAPFDCINPCGYSGLAVTDLAALSATPPDYAAVSQALAEALRSSLASPTAFS